LGKALCVTNPDWDWPAPSEQQFAREITEQLHITEPTAYLTILESTRRFMSDWDSGEIDDLRLALTL
jgi:hypothetical protein